MGKFANFDFIKGDKGKIYIAGYGNQYYNAKNVMNEKAYSRFEKEVNKVGKDFGVASTYKDYQKSLTDSNSSTGLPFSVQERLKETAVMKDIKKVKERR